ncbi:transposable element Tcb2 transposase [Trichonephila clavipes]|uniref:Transposable element Tcb2 transposase n=1 Tax=Trichonephila clavipes TaxID=2585209 RepID=A0A8X6SRC6_TRICX|nr:transposable element Tcb2 transposase [Trichonephila clavipes]GFY16005.1 transposable element Tcb2 transposase [Trichonephila clavipes]
MQRLSGAIFKQDNAQPHSAGVSQDCLRTVNTLPWLSRSPNLSLIEHIRHHLGRRVGYPTSLNELEARLQQIWNEINRSHHTELLCLNARWPEVMLSIDELNLDQTPQNINKELQLERVRLQAFVAATDSGCKKRTH